MTEFIFATGKPRHWQLYGLLLAPGDLRFLTRQLIGLWERHRVSSPRVSKGCLGIAPCGIRDALSMQPLLTPCHYPNLFTKRAVGFQPANAGGSIKPGVKA